MADPTQAELDAEFQRQLDDEFRAQRQVFRPAPARPATPIPEGAGLADPRFFQQGPQQPSLVRRGLEEAIETAGPAALPVLGGLAGAAAGGLVTSPSLLGIPAGVLAGEAIGSGLGEAANQLAGITEPSGTQIAASTVAPGVARGATAAVGAAARAVVRFMPGFAPGTHQATSASLQALQAKLASGQASVDDLYSIVERYNPKIKTSHLSQALDTLAATESQVAKGLKNPKIARAVAGLKDLLAQNADEVPFAAVRFNLKRIGQRIGALARVGGEEEGAMKLLYRALQEDLEAAASGGGMAGEAVQALKAASAAARREFSLQELDDAIRGAVTTRSDGLVQVSGGKFFKALRDNPKILSGFDPADREAIQQVAKAMSQLRALGPQIGVQFGAGPTLGRGTFVGGAAAVLGADPTTAGAAGALVAGAPHVLRYAMTTEPGRRAIVHLLSTSPTLDHRALAILATAGRALAPPGMIDLAETRRRLGVQ